MFEILDTVAKFIVIILFVLVVFAAFGVWELGGLVWRALQ